MLSDLGKAVNALGELPIYFNRSSKNRFVLTEGETDRSIPGFTFCNFKDFTHKWAMSCLCTSYFGSVHIDKVSDNFDWLALEYLFSMMRYEDIKLSTIDEIAKKNLSQQVEGFCETFFSSNDNLEYSGRKILRILQEMTVVSDW